MNTQLNEIAKVADLSNIYMIVGILVLFNLGTIFSAFYAAGKIVWWLSKMDSKVEQNSKDVNAAHRGLRDVREVVQSVKFNA